MSQAEDAMRFFVRHNRLCLGRYFICMWLGLCFVCLGCQEPNVYQSPPPPAVTVSKPVQHTVSIFLEENGETEAVGRSEVRSRVQGFLEEMRFQPGDDVQVGDVLYVIEKDEHLAIRDGAKAEQAAAKAALSSAGASINVAKADLLAAKVKVEASESEFRRQDLLYKENVTTKSVWEEAQAIRDASLASREQAAAAIDAAIANKETAAAQVAQADAKLKQAELNLSYTEVKALISGRVTSTQVKLGNLVDSGTHLTTIIQQDLIWAHFYLNEQFLISLLNTDRDRDKKEGSFRDTKAFLQRAGDDGFPFEGHLDYYDQEGVDQGTGTFKVRAVFEASSNKLLPGLFVRIRVPIGVLEDAILIPEKSIGRDQSGTYLLVLDDQNTVSRQEVTLGAKYGGLIVVTKGLAADQSVIIDGIQRARPGSKVTPKMMPLEFDTDTLLGETKTNDKSSETPQDLKE